MSENGVKPKYDLRFAWEFNGISHKAIIGNGLIVLVVYPVDLGKPDTDGWHVQINGTKPIKLLPVYHDLDLAKFAAEGRVIAELRPVIELYRTAVQRVD